MGTRSLVNLALGVALLVGALLVYLEGWSGTQGVILRRSPAPERWSAVGSAPAASDDAPAREPLRQLGRIGGRVLDGRGRALAGAMITARERDGGVLRAANAGADGTFQLAGLDAGAWILSGLREGHRAARRELHVDPARPPQRLDLVLHELVPLRVLLLDADSRALEVGAEESGLEASCAPRLEVLETGAAPSLHAARGFWGPGGGMLQAAAGEPIRLRLVLGSRVLDEVRLEALERDAGVALRCDPALLAGLAARLRLTLAEPSPHARLSLEAAGDPEVRRLALGARGAFESALAPGRWRLALWVPGKAWWVREIDLEPGARLELGPLRLEPGRVLRGRVLDDAGRPTSAEVSLERRDAAGTWSPVREPRPAFSDAFTGRFTLEGLSAGAYRASAGGGPALELEAAAEASLELRCAPAFKAGAGSARDLR